MLVEERHALLLRQLRETGRILAKDASLALSVSEDTVRRDLRDLARAGSIKRVHGGAVPVSHAELAFPSRLPISNDAKSAIGRLAASLVEAGQTVFLDGGTTALQVASHLPTDLRGIFVTHSPNIAMALTRCEQLTIEIIGGRLFRHSLTAVGAAALSSITHLRPDISFVGATGIHPDYGLTTGDSEEATIKRAVIERSGAAYVLASPEKLGAVSNFEIAPLDQLDGVLVARTINPTLRQAIAEAGCKVMVA